MQKENAALVAQLELKKNEFASAATGKLRAMKARGADVDKATNDAVVLSKDDLTLKQSEMINTITTISDSIKNLEKQVQNRITRVIVQLSDQELKQVQNKLDDALKKLKESETALAKLKKEIEKQKDSNAQGSEKMNTQRKEIERLKDELDAKEREINELQQRLQRCVQLTLLISTSELDIIKRQQQEKQGKELVSLRIKFDRWALWLCTLYALLSCMVVYIIKW